MGTLHSPAWSHSRGRGHRGHTWVAGAGFDVLTVNFVLAIYGSRDDAAAIAFVAGSYLTLLLLFGALCEYERAPSARARERRVVWPLTTLLTLAFAWKVAAVMPSPVVTAVVWGLTVATTAGGFFALFIPG